MAITMQGNWTLRVKARNAAYAQRFIVSGAAVGNGVHDGVVDGQVFVCGPQWTLRVQHRPTRGDWCDSALRLGLPQVSEGLVLVDLGANDGGLDDDYDDLVLACSLPASECDHLVYGDVTVHDGASPFNPRRDDHLVIEAPAQLESLCERHPRFAAIVDRLYPGLPCAEHDITPLVIPTGLPRAAVGLLFRSRDVGPAEPGADEAAAVQRLRTQVRRAPFDGRADKAGGHGLTHADLEVIASIRQHTFRQATVAHPVRAGLRLGFQRYQLSAAEAAGGAHMGKGLREEMGAAMTDDCGRYLFRFRRDRGSPLPRLIIQVLGTGLRPAFETAPYEEVANLRRIDLCIPQRACRQASSTATGATGAGVFEYVGATALTVIGPASGRCYRFGQPGASLWVDQRDRSLLTGIRSLRPLRAA